MAFLNLNSFNVAQRISFPSNVPVRTDLLAELDRKMHACVAVKTKARANCPEHLYSIDEDKMMAARGLNG